MRFQLFESSSIRTFLWLDPRTKLLLLLVISTVMVSGSIEGYAIYPRLLLASLPFILLLQGRRINAAVLYAFLLTASWLAEAFLVYSTEGVVSIVAVMFSGLISRFIPGVVMGYYVMSTTRVSEFICAMERMHMPRAIVIPLAVMFRFFPTIFEEAHSIGDAMRMRGVGLGSGRLMQNPLAMLEYRLVPLLMSTVKIGEELSAASLTRGLGNPVKRTNICRIGFGFQDILLSALAVIGFIGFIVF